MHTGLSSQADSLTAMLRRCAYNRVSGALEFEAHGRKFTIVVVHGKVAAVEDDGWDVADEVVRRLTVAGRIPGDLSFETITTDQLFSELESRMPGNLQPVDEVFFRRVVREAVLDKLLSLPLTEAKYRNTAGLCGDISPRFSPAIDIEDLRYDAETISELIPRVRQVFPVGRRIAGVRCTIHRFSPVEQTIVGLLSKPLDVETLYRRALYSRVRFYEGLLSLLDRGILEVSDLESSDRGTQVASALTAVIEASVEVEEVGEALAQAAIAEKAETEILQTELSPRGLVSLLRRLTGV